MENNVRQQIAANVSAVAMMLFERGVSCFPLVDKKPACKWGELIGNPRPPSDWPAGVIEYAIITGAECGVVVIDCDSGDSARLWLASEVATPLTVRTRRGMHFYYRHPGGDHYVKSDSHISHKAGFEYDVKGDRSYVVGPASVRDGTQYRVTGFDVPEFRNLPPFQPEWRPDRKPPSALDTPEIRDVFRYVATIKAVSGAGGHKDTYRVVCRFHDAGLSETDALAALVEWNQTNADPPWSVRELLHKIRSVYGG